MTDTAASAALLEQEQSLAANVRRHKTAIRQHRKELETAAAQLEAVRERCRSLGIGFRHVIGGPDRPRGE